MLFVNGLTCQGNINYGDFRVPKHPIYINLGRCSIASNTPVNLRYIKLRFNMRQFALLMLALVGLASSVPSSMDYKVYRIRPKNEEQLQFLRKLNEDEGNDVSSCRLLPKLIRS